MPQVHEVLAEVVVEVVGGGGVGYHDGEGGPFQLTALELFKPGGEALAAAQGALGDREGAITLSLLKEPLVAFASSPGFASPSFFP